MFASGTFSTFRGTWADHHPCYHSLVYISVWSPASDRGFGHELSPHPRHCFIALAVAPFQLPSASRTAGNWRDPQRTSRQSCGTHK
ncbi:hypothetical protein BD310DRAFT_577298 [Dichomitus squalens]|uniref:Uncharacterized protein n=1 Tax=Dichomitus squalens TaxID=114155 RepID=A0A4Q9Q8L7_9APHY|nr:hypothetical protein BD310DRAFT_577298 [Dichomitus squalens]